MCITRIIREFLQRAGRSFRLRVTGLTGNAGMQLLGVSQQALCVACYFRDDPSFPISFVCVSFFFSVDIHQCDNSAIDFVIRCAIWPHPQRVLAASLSATLRSRVPNVSTRRAGIFSNVGNIKLGRSSLNADRRHQSAK